MDATTQDLLSPWVLAGALAAMLVVAALVLVFINATAKKVAPVALLLAGFCLEVYFFKQPFFNLGLQVYPNDIISVIVLLAALVGFAYRPLPMNDSPFLLWLAFGVTMIASFVVGLSEHGRYAGTEVRPFFYMWVAGLYCCVAGFDEKDLGRIARWCLWTAYALIGIAAYYYLAVEVGVVNRAETFDGPLDGVFRPVGSHGTFFVGAVGLVQTMAWLRRTGTRLAGLHAAIFMAFVVLMQHRSVWIAVGVGLLAVFLLERRHLPRRFALLLGFTMAVALATAIAAAFGMLDSLTRDLTRSTITMFESEGTFAGRVDGWIRLLEQWLAASPMTLLFGFPFGQGYTRLYNGVVIEFAPHNFFIDLLLRVGIVGTLLFLLATLLALLHGLFAKVISEFDYLLARGLGVALVASLVYFVAYPSYYLIGGATGLALAHLIAHRHRQRAPGRPLDPVRSPITGQVIGWHARR
ncbi:MAG: O-antigen ligase family protein [Rubrivivax sp.]|nr:O-antigen ligase family protein [Rubrivivax sp.]